MSDLKKINTAIKYANDEGCLICDIDGKMKSINVSTETGWHRMNATFRDSPETVVGFYKINDEFTEDIVRAYIQEDVKNLVYALNPTVSNPTLTTLKYTICETV